MGHKCEIVASDDFFRVMCEAEEMRGDKVKASR